MTMRYVFLAAALAVLTSNAPADRAMLADVSIEAVVGEADRVVAGEVVEVGAPVRQNIQLPHMKAPGQVWVRTYKIKVIRTIKPSPAVKVAEPREKAKPMARDVKEEKSEVLSVIARSTPPQPAGKPRLMISDGPAYASLQKGTSYILVLQNVPGKREELFLPSYPKNYAPLSNTDRVKEIEKAANVDAWSWGKAVNGLQMAMLVPESAVQRSYRTRDANGRWNQTTQTYVQMTFALRNTTKKDIYISLYPGDRYLDVALKGAGGQIVQPDLYGSLARMRMKAFGPAYTHCIKPGKIMFITQMGKGSYGMGATMDLKPGKWTAAATLTLKRKDDTGRKDLWTGELESKPTMVEVKPAAGGKPTPPILRRSISR